MLQCDYKTFQLPFEYPFKISKGVKEHQDAFLVFLGMGAQYGLGEATAISYYDMPLQRITSDFEQIKGTLRKYAYNGPERFWHYLHHLIPNNNFLIAALDTASWDLWSKLRGKPLYQMLNLEWQTAQNNDYTLGIDDLNSLELKLAKHPYPKYKLKVSGTEADIEIINFITQKTKAQIRLDANEAWNFDTACQLLNAIDTKRIELIEQPFSDELPEANLELKHAYGIPIIADESIKNEQDLSDKLRYFDGVNIKLSKSGGITPALRMIETIKKANKQVMLGCMSESTVGSAALAHLAGLAEYLDIDGPLLQTEQITKGLTYDSDGNISVANPAGIGVAF